MEQKKFRFTDPKARGTILGGELAEMSIAGKELQHSTPAVGEQPQIKTTVSNHKQHSIPLSEQSLARSETCRRNKEKERM